MRQAASLRKLNLTLYLLAGRHCKKTEKQVGCCQTLKLGERSRLSPVGLLGGWTESTLRPTSCNCPSCDGNSAAWC